jgi:hypothetical protein
LLSIFRLTLGGPEKPKDLATAWQRSTQQAAAAKQQEAGKDETAAECKMTTFIGRDGPSKAYIPPPTTEVPVRLCAAPAGPTTAAAAAAAAYIQAYSKSPYTWLIFLIHLAMAYRSLQTKSGITL